MGRLLRYEPCPRCRAEGRDRRGDNLARYADDSSHCFSCGYHTVPRLYVKKEKQHEPKEGPLPRDFTREVPAEGWKWLLSFGLPYSYWKPFTGFSPSTGRLILTHGNPVEISVGRYIGQPHRESSLPWSSNPRTSQHEGGRQGGIPGNRILENLGSGTQKEEEPRKWRMWGNRLGTAVILEPKDADSAERVVLVEDLISAHKVAQVTACLPLFGTNLYPKAISTLRALKRPILLWLDGDQYPLLAPKINRLQAFLDVPVGFIRTDKDPKGFSTDEIKGILNERIHD